MKAYSNICKFIATGGAVMLDAFQSFENMRMNLNWFSF